MTDMVAGQDIPGAGREFSKIDNLCPADQEEAPSNQPAAEMREQSSSSKHGVEGRSSGVAESASQWARNNLTKMLLSIRSYFSQFLIPELPHRFTKITREPQAPIGID